MTGDYITPAGDRWCCRTCYRLATGKTAADEPIAGPPVRRAAWCGGCRGLGAHSPKCPTQPGAHWRRLADDAEHLGDRIGASDPVAANRAYALAGQLLARWQDAKRQAAEGDHGR